MPLSSEIPSGFGLDNELSRPTDGAGALETGAEVGDEKNFLTAPEIALSKSPRSIARIW